MLKFLVLVLGTTIFLPTFLGAYPPAAGLPVRGGKAASSSRPAQAVATPKPIAPSTPQPPTDKLLQLDIAEYQVLSARSTNWTTLQYGLMPLMAAALAILIAHWPRFSSGFGTWAAAILYQAVIVAHLLVLCMLFNNVRYIECDLRPMIEHLVGPGFWRYEHYMLSRSPYLPVGDYLLAPQALIALLVAIWFRLKSWTGWGGSDWFWGPVSGAVFALSVMLTSSMIAIHRDFMACAAR